MELTACSPEEPQLPQGRERADLQPRGSPRILSPDLVPRAGCLLPLEDPCGLHAALGRPLLLVTKRGLTKETADGRWRVQRLLCPPPGLHWPFHWSFCLPSGPPPVPLQPEAIGKVPSPALASTPPLCSARQWFSMTSSLCMPPLEPPPGAAILNALRLCPPFHASGPPLMRCSF